MRELLTLLFLAFLLHFNVVISITCDTLSGEVSFNDVKKCTQIKGSGQTITVKIGDVDENEWWFFSGKLEKLEYVIIRIENSNIKSVNFASLKSVSSSCALIVENSPSLEDFSMSAQGPDLTSFVTFKFNNNPKLKSVKVMTVPDKFTIDGHSLVFSHNMALDTISLPGDCVKSLDELTVEGNPLLKKASLDYFEKLNSRISSKYVQDEGECIFKEAISDLGELAICKYVKGDLTVAKDVQGSAGNTVLSLVNGSVFLKNPKMEQLGFLSGTNVTGQTECQFDQEIANLDIIQLCNVVKGDLKLAPGVTGSAGSRALTRIEGDVDLQDAEEEKLDFLKGTDIKGTITGWCLTSLHGKSVKKTGAKGGATCPEDISSTPLDDPSKSNSNLPGQGEEESDFFIWLSGPIPMGVTAALLLIIIAILLYMLYRLHKRKQKLKLAKERLAKERFAKLAEATKPAEVIQPPVIIIKKKKKKPKKIRPPPEPPRPLELIAINTVYDPVSITEREPWERLKKLTDEILTFNPLEFLEVSPLLNYSYYVPGYMDTTGMTMRCKYDILLLKYANWRPEMHAIPVPLCPDEDDDVRDKYMNPKMQHREDKEQLYDTILQRKASKKIALCLWSHDLLESAFPILRPFVEEETLAEDRQAIEDRKMDTRKMIELEKERYRDGMMSRDAQFYEPDPEGDEKFRKVMDEQDKLLKAIEDRKREAREMKTAKEVEMETGKENEMEMGKEDEMRTSKEDEMKTPVEEEMKTPVEEEKKLEEEKGERKQAGKGKTPKATPKKGSRETGKATSKTKPMVKKGGRETGKATVKTKPMAKTPKSQEVSKPPTSKPTSTATTPASRETPKATSMTRSPAKSAEATTATPSPISQETRKVTSKGQSMETTSPVSRETSISRETKSAESPGPKLPEPISYTVKVDDSVNIMDYFYKKLEPANTPDEGMVSVYPFHVTKRENPWPEAKEQLTFVLASAWPMRALGADTCTTFRVLHWARKQLPAATVYILTDDGYKDMCAEVAQCIYDSVMQPKPMPPITFLGACRLITARREKSWDDPNMLLFLQRNILFWAIEAGIIEMGDERLANWDRIYRCLMLRSRATPAVRLYDPDNLPSPRDLWRVERDFLRCGDAEYQRAKQIPGEKLGIWRCDMGRATPEPLTTAGRKGTPEPQTFVQKCISFRKAWGQKCVYDGGPPEDSTSCGDDYDDRDPYKRPRMPEEEEEFKVGKNEVMNEAQEVAYVLATTTNAKESRRPIRMPKEVMAHDTIPEWEWQKKIIRGKFDGREFNGWRMSSDIDNFICAGPLGYCEYITPLRRPFKKEKMDEDRQGEYSMKTGLPQILEMDGLGQ